MAVEENCADLTWNLGFDSPQMNTGRCLVDFYTSELMEN